MGIERVRKYFKEEGIADKIQEFDVSSATVELAAKALGVEGQRIAKTLSFRKDDSCILVVTAGDMRIDNSKFKKTFGMKAKMLSPDEVIKYTGYQVGGVCPFDIDNEISIYLDKSLQRFTTVFPACGSSNSAIELDLDELLRYSNAKQWVDVCK